MSSHNRRVVVAVAVLVAVLGLVVGLWPHSAGSGGDSPGCGSAFAPADTSGNDFTGAALKSVVTDGGDLSTAQAQLASNCDDATSGPRTFAFVLIGVGVLGAATAGLLREPQRAT